MKKFVILFITFSAVIILAFISIIYFPIFKGDYYIKSLDFRFAHELLSLAEKADVYMDEKGEWPDSLSCLLSEYPEISNNLSISDDVIMETYLYTPYVEDIGYGVFSVKNSYIKLAHPRYLKHNKISIRFPVGESILWNSNFEYERPSPYVSF